MIFHTLFDQYQDSVFVVDTNGKLLHYNKSVRDTFGYTDRDLSRGFESYFKKANNKSSQYFNLALSGMAQNFKHILLHKNGKEIHVDSTYIPLMNEEMEVVAVCGIAKNITEFSKHEEEVNRIKSSLELAQKVGKIGSWDYDVLRDHLYLSQQFLEFQKREQCHMQIANKELGLQTVHPDDREMYRKVLQQSLNEGKGYSIEYRIIREDMSFIYVSEQVEMILNEEGNPIRLVGTSQDITKRKMAEKKLHESESRSQHIYNNLSLGIRSIDVCNDKILLISPGITDVTGYKPEFFDRKGAWDSIIHPDDLRFYHIEYSNLDKGKSFNIQYRIYHKNSEIVWVQDKTIPVLDDEGNLIRIDGFVSDISAQKKFEERIRHLAYHDHLTDLPNRKQFEEKIESLIEIATEKDSTFAIMYVDLDRFHNLNNTLGHGIGDKLLQQFGLKIINYLPPSSLLSRIGGDEFGIVLWDYEQTDYPEMIAKKILDGMKEPFMIEDFELVITASIGISSFPYNGTTLEEMTKNVDAARYRAKANGKNNYQIYSSTLDIISFKKFDLERDLRKSIEKDQLFLHLQPRVEASTGRIVSAEALVRWDHPVWGEVSPGEFIPLAEETGFINDIGDWVLQQVCDYISDWKQKDLPVVPISINIAAQRFLRSDWKSTLTSILWDTDVDPTFIELEITETTIIQHEKAIEAALQFIKSLGIKIALDDFGTGYSSLSHIKDLSIDTIKIDQSFTRQITKAPNVEVIIKSIIFMANGLNINVVAEGVETLEELAFLKQQGCDEIQGYIFSKPVPEQTFKALLCKGYLKPYINSENPKRPNRRKYYRIELLFPLRSKMTLISIGGKEVKLGKTEALIEDIGAGGLKFLSNMELPMRPDVVFQFETTVLNRTIYLNGHIVWKNEIEGIFQYGLEYTINEIERGELLKLLYHFTLQLKNTPLVPGCHFVEKEKINYVKKLSQRNKEGKD